VIDFGILAMDTILNEVCVLVTAAFALTLVPGFRRPERSLLSRRDQGTALLVFTILALIEEATVSHAGLIHERIVAVCAAGLVAGPGVGLSVSVFVTWLAVAHHGLPLGPITTWGSLHIPAERVNSDHTVGSDPDFSQFPQDFVHIGGASGCYGTRSVPLECLHLATFKDDGTLTWILQVTGSDRLGITPIYLSLIDMHVVVNMLRSGRGSFSSRLEIPD
jgi:hypothetical protein